MSINVPFSGTHCLRLPSPSAGARARTIGARHWRPSSDWPLRTPPSSPSIPSPALCDLDTCATKEGNEIIYQDRTHLDIAGAMRLRPVFARRSAPRPVRLQRLQGKGPHNRPAAGYDPPLTIPGLVCLALGTALAGWAIAAALLSWNYQRAMSQQVHLLRTWAPAVAQASALGRAQAGASEMLNDAVLRSRVRRPERLERQLIQMHRVGRRVGAVACRSTG
jgi:hypothetical protein